MWRKWRDGFSEGNINRRRRSADVHSGVKLPTTYSEYLENDCYILSAKDLAEKRYRARRVYARDVPPLRACQDPLSLQIAKMQRIFFR